MIAPAVGVGDRSGLQRALQAVLSASLVLALLAAVGAQAAGATSGLSESAASESSSNDAGDAASSTMMPGESLSAGESISSPNGRYELAFQHDGNLVLYDTDGFLARWDSRTVGQSDRTLIMQPDGNLVLYELPVTPFDALWHSRTYDWPGAFLTVRDDGTMTIGHTDGRVLWTVGTSTPDVGLAGTKHVVYGVGNQRMWLVGADGSLVDTYLVSGRVGTPAPGRYRVFSKSVNAWSFTPGVTMNHMVRFTRGRSGAAIGFHSIPNDRHGTPIQTIDELGEHRSAGCVRQRNDKATQLYEWAPIGTPVVVIA